jgi:ferrous iron transport protein B
LLSKVNAYPDIVFIGQPNAGKSSLFNAIAGLKVQTSNFPGTTIQHFHSKVNVYGRIFNIIDLPGTYSLNPSDDAEKVALTHLFSEKPDLIVNVIDASVLGRSLELTLELLELEYPMVIALNMMDLAERKGIVINVEELEKILGVPVVPTIASHGRGLKELLEACLDGLDNGDAPRAKVWSKDVEDQVQNLIRQTPEDFPRVANPRFTAIKMIESEGLFFDTMLDEINPELKKVLDETRANLEERHSAPAYEVIAAERHHLGMKLFEECCRIKRGKAISFLDRADDVLMHPVYGYIILLAVFLAFFFLIFKVGNPLEELLLGPME